MLPAARERCGRRRKSASARRPCPAGRSVPSSVSVTLRNCGPVTPGNTVMASQAFVQERVVGGQEIHHATVLQKDAADESFRLGRKITPQLIVESREQHRVGLHGSRLSRFSHFIAKLVTRLEALGSANMRRTCFSIAPGLVKPSRAARVSSSSSGPVFQRKKERREANSRSVRANSVSGACP